MSENKQPQFTDAEIDAFIAENGKILKCPDAKQDFKTVPMTREQIVELMASVAANPEKGGEVLTLLRWIAEGNEEIAIDIAASRAAKNKLAALPVDGGLPSGGEAK